MSLTVSMTEAAERLPELIEQARHLNETMEITHAGNVVARITPIAPKVRTGPEIAAEMRKWEKLPPEEAAAFADDIEAGIASLPPLVSKWD